MEMFLTILGLLIIIFKLAVFFTIVGFFVWLFIRFFSIIVGLLGYGLLAVLGLVGFLIAMGVIAHLS